MSIHKPVLLEETIENLNLKKGMIVVDATLGGGGHGREIIKYIGDSGTYIGIDLDKNAISNFAQLPITNYQLPNNFQIPIFKFQNQILINGNFSELKKFLAVLQIEKVDAIIADLGWSSDQVASVEHGMSFQVEAPLDMRYGRNQELTAKKIVNEYSQEELEQMIEKYAEERFFKSIAKRIIEFRKNHTIETTTQLADIIKNAVPPKNRYGKIDPATRTFQALRIEANRELENLEKFLPDAIEVLVTKGRLAVISFHSLEDRIVKKIYAENARGCICPPTLPKCVCGRVPIIKIISKKPIVPSDREIAENPRARSAKLRVCEKI